MQEKVVVLVFGGLDFLFMHQLVVSRCVGRKEGGGAHSELAAMIKDNTQYVTQYDIIT